MRRFIMGGGSFFLPLHQRLVVFGFIWRVARVPFRPSVLTTSELEPFAEKALGAHVTEAITTLQTTLDEGTRRNTRDFLDKYEDLNQKLISERKRADRMEEALRTGARLGPDGEPNFASAGYDRSNNPEYKNFMYWLSRGNAMEFRPTNATVAFLAGTPKLST